MEGFGRADGGWLLIGYFNVGLSYIQNNINFLRYENNI